MQLDDDVAAGFEPPGGTRRYVVRRLPRRPPEELSLRVAGVRDHSADISRFRIALIEQT